MVSVTGNWTKQKNIHRKRAIRSSFWAAKIIASAWVVRKATSDGVVTALELFDEKGEVIALLFGKRKPGQPESEGWRGLIATVERDHALVRAE